MADNLNTPSLLEIKPLTRRDVMAGAAAAVTAALLPIAVMVAIPTFEEAVEALTLEMEELGFKFYVGTSGLMIGVRGVRRRTPDDFHVDLHSRFHTLWDEDSQRYRAKLLSMGRVSSGVLT